MLAVAAVLLYVGAAEMGGTGAFFNDQEASTGNRMGTGAWWDETLVLDLRLDEGSGTVAHDWSRYKNDGTIYEAGWTSGPPYGPYKGYALDFDGVDDYVDSGNDASLDLTEAVTVEAWIKIEDYAPYQAIVSKFSSSRGYWIRLGAGAGLGRAEWLLGDNGVERAVSSTTDLSLDTWYHVVGTLGAGTARIYINGVDEGSTPASVSSTPASLGVGEWLGMGYHFNGIIDRVRVYNRALTLDEVQQSYDSSKGDYEEP